MSVELEPWFLALIEHVNRVIDKRRNLGIATIETDPTGINTTVRGYFDAGGRSFSYSVSGPLEPVLHDDVTLPNSLTPAGRAY